MLKRPVVASMAGITSTNPMRKAVIDNLLVRYIEALVYQALAENMASEHRRAWWP
jgi:F0F1-type ATP synthase gamma subunit